jgi:hypothetical protein
MDDFNPGVETLYYTIRSRHRFPEVKKPSFCFLVIEIVTTTHARISHDNFSPGLKILSSNRAFDFDRVLY